MKKKLLGALCLIVACAVAALPASVASAKSGHGVICVLHAKLAAKNEVPPTTSVAKGHTQIKVRNDGTMAAGDGAVAILASRLNARP